MIILAHTKSSICYNTIQMSQQIKPIPFTPQKYQEMQDKVTQLEKLKEEVMQRLVTARAMGDLSENGAYKYAKFEIGNVKRQLRRFNYLLANGYPTTQTNKNPNHGISFGDTITIERLDDTKKQLTFMIVSQHESDPTENKLSFDSPIGKAVMDKKIGDEVKVKTPSGDIFYLILKVE